MLRAKTLNCFTKSVRNWFSYQRKLHFQREKKKDESPMKIEPTPTPLNLSPISPKKVRSSIPQISNIKTEEVTIMKKEEPMSLHSGPILPLAKGIIQSSPLSTFYQKTFYQGNYAMNNAYAQYANSIQAMLSAKRIMPPFGFNFF